MLQLQTLSRSQSSLSLLLILVNLHNRTGEERRRQTFCDKRDDNFVWNKFSPNFTFSLDRSFCERPENISVKWRSRQSTQVIALSHLSRTAFCCPLLPADLLRKLITNGRIAIKESARGNGKEEREETSFPPSNHPSHFLPSRFSRFLRVQSKQRHLGTSQLQTGNMLECRFLQKVILSPALFLFKDKSQEKDTLERYTGSNLCLFKRLVLMP